MKSDVFYEYVANGFHKWLEDNQIPRPVILFVDGHKSYMTLELSQFCSSHDIILYALPPNTTHMMQPADVAVFKPLKSEWKKTVSVWQRSSGIQNVTRATFCPLLEHVLQISTLPDSIQNGFRKCGLYPYNPDNVDYSKCIKNTLEKLSCSDQEIQTAISGISGGQYDSAIDIIKSITPKLEQRNVSKDVIDTIVSEILNEKQRWLNISLVESSEVNISLSDVFACFTPGTCDFGLDEYNMENFPSGSSLPPISNHFSPCSSTPNRPVSLVDSPSSFTKVLMSSPSSSTTNICINSPSSSSTKNLKNSPSSSTCIIRVSSGACSPSFDRHLKMPTSDILVNKNKTRKRNTQPSAISSAKWRKLAMEKEADKIKK